MFRSVLLALMALLAVSAVVSASASAWALNKEAVTESTPITFSQRTGIHVPPFEMEGNGELGGTSEIHCSGVTGKGTVAPEGAGTITEFKLSGCARTKGSCVLPEGAESVKAVDLPWKTQEAKTDGEPGDWVEPDGAGSPGWEFECKFGSAKYHVKCTTGRYESLLDEVGEEVFQYFEHFVTAGGLNCNKLGERTGEVQDQITLKGPGGKRLER